MTKKRKLYYFHIQHDGSEIDEYYRRVTDGINVDQEWRAIKRTLENLATPNKMYNDSFLLKAKGPHVVETLLPIQLREVLAAKPHPLSNNDRALFDLASRGVTPVACESKTLYDNSWQHINSIMTRSGSGVYAQDVERMLDLAFQRNEFISGQIDRSLRPGETGVLFLGHLHGFRNDMLERLTASGIQVEEKNQCRASDILKYLFGLDESKLSNLVIPPLFVKRTI
jgi:hypothetical protein